MKKLFTLIMLMVVTIAASAAKKGEYYPSSVSYAQALGLGWNMGNSLDAHENGVSGETLWHDQKATQATFYAVKRAGFNSVRIPVTWMGHIGGAPDYRIDPAQLNRVIEVAIYAKRAGLKAIINIHHDGFGDEKDPIKRQNHWLLIEDASKNERLNKEIKAKLYAVWSQIAKAFNGEGEWLMFETMNEIQDGKWGGGSNLTDGGRQYRVLNEWNQVCVDAIRNAGGENSHRYIGIPGYVTSPDLTIKTLVLPKDRVRDHLLVAVHSYDPWDYAGSGKRSEWGHTGKDVVEGTSEKTYTDMLDKLYNHFVMKGIGVYFGEFGCVHRKDKDAEAFRLYYLEYVCKAFSDRKMGAFFWDNGYYLEGDDAFGLIDHGTGKWIYNGKEAVKRMVKGYYKKGTKYTQKSIYDRAPKSKRK